MGATPVYLNNAGTSWPKPPDVVEAAASAWASEPAAAAGLFERVQRGLCELMGAPAPERMLLTPGCTAALALALDDLPWEAGDAILTSALEHHALTRPVDRLVRTRGVEHRVAPRAADGPCDLEAARAMLSDGRVRLVAVTHASNVTGELLPIAELAALAHERGALLLLDAAQTLGVVPMRVQQLGVDVVVFAGHKGPLAPQGIGGLWAAPHVRFDSPAAVCELDEHGGPTPTCSPFPGYCDVGSVSLGALAGLDVALAWRRREGEARWEHARALASEATAALAGRDGCRVIGAGGEHTAALSVLVDGLALPAAEAHFERRGIRVRAGQHCAPMALQALGTPQGTLRVSFGPFNERADLSAFMDALPAPARG
jgi:selenocysteine lyase/cysteine desulfurase